MVVTDLKGQLLETNALKPSSGYPRIFIFIKNARSGAIAHTPPE